MWKQAVMGRHVMIGRSAFLLVTSKHVRHMFSAFNGRHLGLLLDAEEQTIIKI